MTSTQIEVKDYRYFAGNQWRKAADDQFFEVHEPYSGQLFARVAAGSRADARSCGCSSQSVPSVGRFHAGRKSSSILEGI